MSPPPDLSNIKHGIIGCGRVAPNHVTGVREDPQSSVLWACDRDPVALAAFAKRHRISHTTTDYREMLADPELTSVSIVVDHAQHAALALDALLAGKHVLVEKPLALSLQEGQALVDLAAQRNLHLATIAQHRFDPLVIEVKRLLAAGALGQLVSVWVTLVCGREPSYYSDSYWRGTWPHEGGSLLVNQAYHCVDLMVELGGRPRPLSCDTRILKLGDVLETEDVVTATMEFPGGALGSLGCTSATRDSWCSRFNVIGTDGDITFDINHPGVLHSYSLPNHVDSTALIAAANGRVGPPRRRWWTGPLARLRSGTWRKRLAILSKRPPGIGYYGLSHNRQIRDFLDAIRDRRPALVRPDAGLITLEVILELYELAHKRREDFLLRHAP